MFFSIVPMQPQSTIVVSIEAPINRTNGVQLVSHGGVRACAGSLQPPSCLLGFYRGYLGIMDKKMETTIEGLGFIVGLMPIIMDVSHEQPIAAPEKEPSSF